MKLIILKFIRSQTGIVIILLGFTIAAFLYKKNIRDDLRNKSLTGKTMGVMTSFHKARQSTTTYKYNCTYYVNGKKYNRPLVGRKELVERGFTVGDSIRIIYLLRSPSNARIYPKGTNPGWLE